MWTETYNKPGQTLYPPFWPREWPVGDAGRLGTEHQQDQAVPTLVQMPQVLVIAGIKVSGLARSHVQSILYRVWLERTEYGLLCIVVTPSMGYCVN